MRFDFINQAFTEFLSPDPCSDRSQKKLIEAGTIHFSELCCLLMDALRNAKSNAARKIMSLNWCRNILPLL